MANYVYIATSIDGYIAAENDGLEWLDDIPNPDESDFGFSEFMNGIDALVMGRNSYEVVLSFDMWLYTKPVFVCSTTLSELKQPKDGTAELIRGTPREIQTKLNERGYNNLYIDGGKTIQAFLKEDLIDELIITQLPVILGRGIPLFSPMDISLKFDYVSTDVYNDAMVKNHFRRKRG